MAVVDIRWETPEERDAVEHAIYLWLLFGELHLTNNGGRGIAVLDPVGITYRPTGNEVAAPPPDGEEKGRSPISVAKGE